VTFPPRGLIEDRVALRPLRIGAGARARWLLEVFDLANPVNDNTRRHAVWLSGTGLSWHWWCCCGVRSSLEAEGRDLIQILTLARMHFDSFSACIPTQVDHPAAAWNDRILGQPARDDLAVRNVAKLLL
jgi:hypothetical protein